MTQAMSADPSASAGMVQAVLDTQFLTGVSLAFVLVLSVVALIVYTVWFRHFTRRLHELSALVDEQNATIDLLHEQLRSASEAASQLQEALMQSSRLDHLTEALSEDSFLEEVDRELEVARRTEIPHCMIALQATRPEQRGDPLIAQKLIAALRRRMRAGDRIAHADAHYQQFAILLNNTALDDAKQLCQGLVLWLEREHDLQMTAGISEMIIHRDRAQSLLGRAIQALEYACDAADIQGSWGPPSERVLERSPDLTSSDDDEPGHIDDVDR